VNRQQGISLVELMIASLLGLILSSAILSTLYASIAANKLKVAAESIHENSSLAMHFLAADIRAIDFSGCFNTRVSNANIVSTGRVADHLQRFGAIFAEHKSYNNSDAFSFVSALDAGFELNQNMSNVHSSVDLLADSEVANHREVFITNCQVADLFTISGQWNSRLYHDMPDNSSANLSAVYSRGSMLYPLSVVSYKIARGASGRAGLYRKVNSRYFQELIPNVEQLRIYYASKQGLDNKMLYRSSSQISNYDDVISIHLKLLLSSPTEVLKQQSHYQNLQGQRVKAQDRRLYKSFEMTVALRNRLIAGD